MLDLELKRFRSSGMLDQAGDKFAVLSKKPFVVTMKVSDSVIHLTLRKAWHLSTRAVLNSNRSNLLRTTGPMASKLEAKNNVMWW